MASDDDSKRPGIRLLKPQPDTVHGKMLHEMGNVIREVANGPPVAAFAIVTVHDDGTCGAVAIRGEKYFALVGGLTDLVQRMGRDADG